MSKFFLLPIVVFALVVSGCGTKPAQLGEGEQQTDNTLLAQGNSWCTEPMSETAPEDKKQVWISSEYYQGTNHAPTIRHICRGEKELFYLQMDWDDKVATHTGKLIAIPLLNTGDNPITFPIVSTRKDPEVNVVESEGTEYPNQVFLSVDGKVVIYDEVDSSFRFENSSDTEENSAASGQVIYNIFAVEKKNQIFYVTLAASVWFGGEKAVEVAIKETGCLTARIRDGNCAPSLSNGFYISKKFGPKSTLPLASTAEIFIYEQSELTKITPEHFFNLFTQTDAFTMEDSHMPFIIQIKNGSIQTIQSHYTP